MPYGGALGRVLLYRKDLFDAEGVPYPTVDWTWDDLLDAAAPITDPEQGIYGMLLGRGKHESWYWITFLWSAGAEIMTTIEDRGMGNRLRCPRRRPRPSTSIPALSTEQWVDAKGRRRRLLLQGRVGCLHQVAARRDRDGHELHRREDVRHHQPRSDRHGAGAHGPHRDPGGRVEQPDDGPVPEIDRPGGARCGVGVHALLRLPRRGRRSGPASWSKAAWAGSSTPSTSRMFGYPEIDRLSPQGWAETFEIAIETGKPGAVRPKQQHRLRPDDRCPSARRSNWRWTGKSARRTRRAAGRDARPCCRRRATRRAGR